jgi:hypothetical protein
VKKNCPQSYELKNKDFCNLKYLDFSMPPHHTCCFFSHRVPWYISELASVEDSCQSAIFISKDSKIM